MATVLMSLSGRLNRCFSWLHQSETEKQNCPNRVCVCVCVIYYSFIELKTVDVP